jgi:SAM-dependent methyltransferase
MEDRCCPACGPGVRSRSWLRDTAVTEYRRCSVCGTVFASPAPPQSIRHTHLDEAFGAGSMAEENETARAQALRQEAMLMQRVVQSGEMLDVGCDLGLLFSWFDERWRRNGVEISASAATTAAQRHGAEVFVGTIREARFQSGRFDLVSMIDMLYHVEDPRADIREAARILKPGGFLAVELSGLTYQLLRSRGPLCWLIERRWTRLRSDLIHLNWLSVPGLLSILNAEGFDVMEAHVVPSPRQRTWLRTALSRLHHASLAFPARFSTRALNFAPKYLLLARSRSDAAVSSPS